MGISPMLLRDRQDEAMGVIIRLLNGEERFSYDSDWFTLHDAALQILPIQERHADGHGVEHQPQRDADRRQVRHRRAVDRLDERRRAAGVADAVGLRRGGRRGHTARRSTARDWRVLMSWHIAETKEQARREAVHGLHRWHNEYNVRVLGRPGANPRRGPVGAARSGRPRAARKVAARQ